MVPSYFDQKRRGLNPKHDLIKTLCPDGGDHLDVMGKSRHVYGYLKDFMFEPKYATQPVSTLSGGQKNRLMLAKTLANPGNFLILDEPTNDLDMDTLDMVEEALSNYPGTLIIVSHDRDFLDQTVTKILAFEGDGVVEGYIGGYSDYLEAKTKEKKDKEPQKEVVTKQKHDVKKTPEDTVKNDKKPRKLSYKYQHELDNLPTNIDALNKEIAKITDILSQDNLYMSDPEKFDKLSRELLKCKENLERSELRWIELEEMRNAL
jgi:ATP-binding cassette subfamily F protein uup